MPGLASQGVAPPRWLADEMVGRLARYLRFVGCDTLYARGWSDDEIVARARTEDRVVLTRDRALAARAHRALLLSSPHLADQWRAVREAYPDLPSEPRFERCSECNGALAPFRPDPGAPREEGIPWDRVDRGLALYRCTDCGHCYWDGSHVASVRERLRTWSAGDRA
jgi:uncharacterized protein